MSSSEKIVGIELARVGCIFTVVLLHAIDMVVAQNGITPLSLILLASMRFIVPMFFIISGFLIGVRLQNPVFTLNSHSFWQIRWRSLVLPFLIWNLIYMLMFKNIYGLPIFTWHTLFNLCTGYQHLYFVFVLLQCLLVYTIIANSLNRQGLKTVVAWAATGTILFYALSELLLWKYGSDGHFFEWNLGKLGLAWGLFFFWGMWLGSSKINVNLLIRYRHFLFTAAIIFFIPYWLETNNQLYYLGAVYRDYFLLSGLPFQFLAASAFLAYIFNREIKIRLSSNLLYLASWGKYMFGVYLCHLFILAYLNKVWIYYFPGDYFFLQVIVLTLPAFSISLGLVKLCSMPPYQFIGNSLFGGRGS